MTKLDWQIWRYELLQWWKRVWHLFASFFVTIGIVLGLYFADFNNEKSRCKDKCPDVHNLCIAGLVAYERCEGWRFGCPGIRRY